MSKYDPARAIIDGLTKVTARWTRQRKAEDRAASQLAHRHARMMRRSRVTIRDAAFDVMEKAYMAASAHGTLPAHARQVMYQARPEIQAATGRHLDDQYFTQTLLPDYMTERGVAWDVVFDERGHFTEPRGDTIGLGTLAVRGYLAGMREPRFSGCEVTKPMVVTAGPSGSFGAVLFIEKEGFLPLFEHVRLAERHDLAIMSTKGVSNTAARRLVERVCRHRVPLLVLHDFDKAGFSILGTLHQDTRRYTFAQPPEIIDLGLRLRDVDELELEGEEAFDRGTARSIAANLRKNGAADDEVRYLLDRRVELNALPSDRLVEFIERKLDECGVEKVIPSAELLATAYRDTVAGISVAEAAEKAIADARKAAGKIATPRDLAERVAAHLEEHPADRWDDAVAAIVGEMQRRAAS